MAAVLSSVSDTDCKKLCHRVVDSLCGQTPIHKQILSCSNQEWLDLLNFLTSLFHKTVAENHSEDKVLAELSEAGVSQSGIVLDVLRSRKEEIRQSLLDRTLSISSTTLQDFDWQLKLALSSDKIASLNTALLTLSLDVRENGVLKPFSIELNRKELAMLITSLENANKVLLQLKG
ncbi:COMM domain-containing protein 8 [Gouania willdenowi]|uniref:COMM domain-containing protein n=1 Tax=Gouania willdenowi TaxID=441366 RepID=A0A8C5GUD9_GOUWI|nr:COMM domain-containing protein 8 [Gouania willdenowi]